MNFEAFFASAEGKGAPYPYQRKLAEGLWPETLAIPTGFGKTATVFGAWLWKLARRDPGTPRRLVYCLPMRTLVEQTVASAERWADAAARHLGLPVHRDAQPLWTAGMGLAPLDIGRHDLAKKDGLAGYAAAVAKAVAGRARPQASTIVFLNTVARAQAVFKALRDHAAAGHAVMLAHSRFRASELALPLWRAGWMRRCFSLLATVRHLVCKTH